MGGDPDFPDLTYAMPSFSFATYSGAFLLQT